MEKELYPGTSRCRPLRIVRDSEGTGRVGGSPPEGVGPEWGSAARYYFATFPIYGLQQGRVASVFTATFRELIPGKGKVNQPGLVQVVSHSPAPRASSSEWKSPLSAHGLELEAEAPDVVADEQDLVVRGGHKIGGRPALIRLRASLEESLRQLEPEGFHFHVQFDFPSSRDDRVAGSWPFGDGIVSIFGRAPFGASDWRWYWDF